MAQKGLLSIGEFSKLTKVPRSKLIYYDDIGLLPAEKRGENNYRYYSLNQIIIVNFIQDLTSFGMPLKELIQISKKRSPELIIEVLTKAHKEHQKRITELREIQSIMGVMIKMMTFGIEAIDEDIEVKQAEPHNYILGDENPHQDATTFFPAFLVFINSAQKAGINTNYPIGGYFNDFDRFQKNTRVPSKFFFINPHGREVREGGKWLCGYARGAYGATEDLPQRMKAFAIEHELELTGPVFHTYLLDEICISDPNNYLMRASIKIKEDE